ncbi:hypothetical protein L3Y34_014249 [Caenorhabditis briggsae]|uniref:Uncharacterized protein n=1 Tax=Caenorhabditis briggsae TaxID=6238 RepID=A0AAE9DS57_CAEBR|nr:hypothetical protein L3Y34_014249 [Caenorhabditis briggsae]
MNCSVDCGIRTHMEINGELDTLSAFDTNSTHYSSPFERIAAGSLEIGKFLRNIALSIFDQFSTLIILVSIFAACVLTLLILRRILSRYLAQRRRNRKILARSKFL